MTLFRLVSAASLLLAMLLHCPAPVKAAPWLLPREAEAFAAGAAQLAQAQPAPDQPAPAAEAPPAPASPEPIGNVAALTGTVTVIRNKDSLPLKLRDDIYLNDIVQTSTASSLGITFDDGTTFRLTANARITIDNYVYADGGKQNAAVFNIARGTVAFVAAAVAKTGEMKIDTPTATLGIRGTTGVIEVPGDAPAAGAAPGNVAIKLYPDADGRVGRIEVNDRQGARLGALTQGASGFSIRPGVPGAAARFAAVPLVIAAREVQRDRGFVREVQTAQTLGRRIVTEQRAFRRANPGLVPNRGGAPRPGVAPAQPRSPRDLQRPPAPAGRQGRQQTPSPQPAGSARPALAPHLPAPAQQMHPGGLREAAPRLQRPPQPVRPTPQRGRPLPRGKNRQAPQLR